MLKNKYEKPKNNYIQANDEDDSTDEKRMPKV